MRRRWLSLLDHVRAYPLRELPLAAPPVRHRQHGLHHFFLRRLQPVTVQLHEDRHGQERDPLVAIPVRVIVRQAPAVRGGQRRHIRGRLVVPLVPRTSERRFERVLVPDARQSSVLAKLVQVNRVDNDALHPLRLATPLPHRYFANSRRALRYFFATRLAIASDFSTFGSYGVRRIPFSVSTANARSPASRCNRSAISLGSVAAIEPPALRRVTSLTIRVLIALLCYSGKDRPDRSTRSEPYRSFLLASSMPASTEAGV